MKLLGLLNGAVNECGQVEQCTICGSRAVATLWWLWEVHKSLFWHTHTPIKGLLHNGAHSCPHKHFHRQTTYKVHYITTYSVLSRYLFFLFLFIHSVFFSCIFLVTNDLFLSSCLLYNSLFTCKVHHVCIVFSHHSFGPFSLPFCRYLRLLSSCFFYSLIICKTNQ